MQVYNNKGHATSPEHPRPAFEWPWPMLASEIALHLFPCLDHVFLLAESVCLIDYCHVWGSIYNIFKTLKSLSLSPQCQLAELSSWEFSCEFSVFIFNINWLLLYIKLLSCYSFNGLLVEWHNILDFTDWDSFKIFCLAVFISIIASKKTIFVLENMFKLGISDLWRVYRP